MEQELTPTQIAIMRKKMYDQIRREEEKDRKLKALQKAIPDIRIHSARKLKKMLRKYKCHEYMITMSKRYLKMISCQSSHNRHILAKTHNVYHNEIQYVHGLSFKDIMNTHYEILLS